MEVVSKRLSFSDSTIRLDSSIPVDPPSLEFDFSSESHLDLSTPADLLFYQGKIIPKPIQSVAEINLPVRSSVTSSFPRSYSTGYSLKQSNSGNGSKFLKSPSESSSKAYYYSRDRNGGLTKGNNGVRINPVINVGTGFISRGGSTSSSSSGGGTTGSSNGGGVRGRGMFAYLLCSCGNTKNEDEGGLL